MKTTIRHYGAVALLLACILTVSTLLSLATGARQGEDATRILVTNYPLYVAAQNVIGDTDGVEVTLLSGAGAGCLHDYQLTPADRLAIQRADKVVINGVGAEPFLEGLVEESRLVDTAVGLSYLCTETAHHHDDPDHHHEHAAYNEHIWLSPAAYLWQVQRVAEALTQLHPALTDAYAANADAYMAQVLAIQYALPSLTDRPCVLFHDSLA